MRVLHINARAGYYGGVEQILHDIAGSMAAAGHPQALLHTDNAPQPAFLENFADAADSREVGTPLLTRFQPDCLLIHKLEDSDKVEALSQYAPTARMIHDHDLVCIRRHKYFPLSTAICEEPAGRACYQHLCFIQRAAPGSRWQIKLASVRPVRRALQAHRGVRHFIVGSQWMHDELSMNGIEASRIRVLPPIPQSLATTQPLPPSEEPEILFVGQVIRGKGVDLLLRALAMQKRSWHATIVGTGNHLDRCKALAQDLEIADQVAFTGWVNHAELETYYQRAMFTVVPSRWPEPFGMVGIEAMARARPVVGFAAGGIPDWLDDGVTGLLAPAADVGALARHIERLLDDSQLRHRLGQQAAESVQARYRPTDFIDKLSHLLSEMIETVSQP